jgi:cation diffusion facilitator CzcD-associated flavoprotein CzcO
MADRGFRVVVAGAGVAGLFMADTLKRARIDFTVYEKASEVGGTWRDNTFRPLCRCAVATVRIPRSATSTGRASTRRRPRSGLRKEVAQRRGLAKFIRFNEEVTAARFSGGRWQAKPPRATRMSPTFHLRHRVSAPAAPADIAGRDNSPARPSTRRAGTTACRATAKRGVIGSGASGCRSQALARAGCDVTQFIRRAQ